MAAIACVSPAGHAQSVDLKSQIESVIFAEVKKGSRGSVFVSHGSRVIVDQTYGLSAGARPVFWLASNSKPITAIAILKLVDEHRLSLDDPLTRFFGSVPDDKRALTVKDLLTHTSGLPHVYVVDGVADRDTAVNILLGLKFGYKTGDGWHYANANYTLLAAIIEIASGLSFEDYLRSRIFRPAGLKETGFWGLDQSSGVLPPLNDMPMMGVKETVYRSGHSVGNWGYRGATGLYSSTADLHRLVEALRRGKIIAHETLEKMWSPVVFIRHDPDSDVYSGLGWYVITKGGKRVAVRHTGSEDVLGHNGIIWLYENGDQMYVLSSAGERDGRGLSAYVGSGINKTLSPPGE